jgi:hypothetical protein
MTTDIHNRDVDKFMNTEKKKVFSFDSLNKS